MEYTERKMKLIDADLLKLGINKNDEIFCTPVRPLIIDLIDNMPTVDVKPVKHGRWIKFDDYVVMCSECGRCEKGLLALSYPYCHCGAKMDGGNE